MIVELNGRAFVECWTVIRALNSARLSSGVGGGGEGVQVHPQKFWFVENSGKITENLGKIPENLGNIPKILAKVAPNVVWLQTGRPKFAEK